MLVISLGWIFFRANLWRRQTTCFPPGFPDSYATHNLSASLYLFVWLLSCRLRVLVLLSRRSSCCKPIATGGFLLRAMVLASSPVPVRDDVAADDHSEQGGGAAQLMYRGF